MSELNLLKYSDHFRIIKSEGVTYVYDVIRKKNIVLLAEEMVRQCILHYLIDEVLISKNLIMVEKGIKVNALARRCDILVNDRNGKHVLLVECKSPKIKLNQKVFNQIAMYNMPLEVPYLMVSNGSKNYFCKIDFEKKDYKFIPKLPSREVLFSLNQ